MNILFLEPYFTGSHATWIKGYQKYSGHSVEVLSLPGQYWKWRMHGAAITLAKQFLAEDLRPDLIIASDMLDVTTFQALTRHKTHATPFYLYFHENQLTYPWSPQDRDIPFRRDKHYGFINYVSALASQKVFFNSAYHRKSFLCALRDFLKRFPDFNEMETVEKIDKKSAILAPGMDLSAFDAHKERGEEIRKIKNISEPVILWNHRWEYDKNPKTFFRALELLDEEGFDFKMVVLGENFQKSPIEFEKAQKRHAKRILHWGFTSDFSEYAAWLWASDLLPITSHQDFFGMSFIEGVYCNCIPLVPQRLSFPELVPEELWPEYGYSHEDELDALVIKLKERLKRFPRNGQEEPLKSHIRQYRWEEMAPIYDQEFSR